MSTAIDTLDERILAELQANGRLTMKALAERVGLSSPAMIERVRRLEERGVIAGYRAVVAPGALGRPLTALILAQVQHADYGSFLEKVNSEPSVAECHRITGEATFLVKVHVADQDQVHRPLGAPAELVNRYFPLKDHPIHQDQHLRWRLRRLGGSSLFEQRRFHLVEVLAPLHERAQRLAHECGIERVGRQQDERARPVEALGDARRLAQIERAHACHEDHDLRCELR